MPRKVGDQVFDMPSQAIRTITKVEHEEGNWYYYVDGPDDPTGDGAFTGGCRNTFEVCAPSKTMPLWY
jgi:hypothetical protein